MNTFKRFGWMLIIILPVIEIWTIVKMSGWIGGFNTLIILIGISILGGYAAKKEAQKVMYEAKMQMNSGQIPGYSLVNGVCVLVGGLLLLIPGFLSDIIGLLLLIPFTRIWFQGIILHWIQKMMRNGNFMIRRF